jgi:hypothetical protein
MKGIKFVEPKLDRTKSLVLNNVPLENIKKLYWFMVFKYLELPEIKQFMCISKKIYIGIIEYMLHPEKSILIPVLPFQHRLYTLSQNKEELFNLILDPYIWIKNVEPNLYWFQLHTYFALNKK